MFNILIGLAIGFVIGLIAFERPQWATDAIVWLKSKFTTKPGAP